MLNPLPMKYIMSFPILAPNAENKIAKYRSGGFNMANKGANHKRYGIVEYGIAFEISETVKNHVKLMYLGSSKIIAVTGLLSF